MTPTVGRIVHYTNLGDKDGKYPPQTQAAMITKVEPKPGVNPLDETDYIVSLKVFYPTGIFDMPSAPYSPLEERGHWRWPERA